MSLFFPPDLSPLRVSLQTAASATAITIVLGTAAAWGRIQLRGFSGILIDGVFLLPLVLPPTAVGLLLLLPLGARGIIGSMLNAWGTPILFTWPAAVLAATILSLPLMYLTARSGFEQLSPTFAEAARTQGASGWTIFWRIILPMTLPSIAAGALLTFARAVGEFGATLMVAGNIPGRTQTIPLAIYFALEDGNTLVAIQWAVFATLFALAAVAMSNLVTRANRVDPHPDC